MNQRSASQATAVNSAARLDLAAVTATEEETEMEKRTVPVLDWGQALPWARGRAAVLAALQRLETEARLETGCQATPWADRLAETHRRVAAWDAATYRRAEAVALRGL
jgi:hypothetical protein